VRESSSSFFSEPAAEVGDEAEEEEEEAEEEEEDAEVGEEEAEVSVLSVPPAPAEDTLGPASFGGRMIVVRVSGNGNGLGIGPTTLRAALRIGGSYCFV